VAVLNARKTADGWELVESPSDDAGMPAKVVASYTGPLAGIEVFFGYWARMLVAMFEWVLRR
jgi:hypothetical protein